MITLWRQTEYTSGFRRVLDEYERISQCPRESEDEDELSGDEEDFEGYDGQEETPCQ